MQPRVQVSAAATLPARTLIHQKLILDLDQRRTAAVVVVLGAAGELVPRYSCVQIADTGGADRRPGIILDGNAAVRKDREGILKCPETAPREVLPAQVGVALWAMLVEVADLPEDVAQGVAAVAVLGANNIQKRN